MKYLGATIKNPLLDIRELSTKSKAAINILFHRMLEFRNRHADVENTKLNFFATVEVTSYKTEQKLQIYKFPNWI